MKKFCKTCGEAMTGRSDKKFCSLECRNKFNNKEYRLVNQKLSKVNGILRNNYVILRHFIESREHCVSKTLLIHMGFNMNYFTHLANGGGNKRYYMCYDVGYSIADHEIMINEDLTVYE